MQKPYSRDVSDIIQFPWVKCSQLLSNMNRSDKRYSAGRISDDLESALLHV